MSGSLITWERLPARPAALAIYAGTVVPGGQPVSVGIENQRTTRKRKIRLPNLFQILSACLTPGAATTRAGVGGTGDRDFLPANPVPPFAATPYSRAASRELNNLGRPLDGRSSSSLALQPLQKSVRGLLQRLSLLVWLLGLHGQNHEARGVVNVRFFGREFKHVVS